jgi:hypothetical protein
MLPQQFRLPLLVAIVLLAIPAGHIHSQAPAPAAADPVADLQAVSAANEDLLKRQADNIAELKDMIDTAHQLRIFTKRS